MSGFRRAQRRVDHAMTALLRDVVRMGRPRYRTARIVWRAEAGLARAEKRWLESQSW